MAARIMSMKNSIDPIGNRTRDLSAGSAVPQPSAPPRALSSVIRVVKSMTKDVWGKQNARG